MLSYHAQVVAALRAARSRRDDRLSQRHAVDHHVEETADDGAVDGRQASRRRSLTACGPSRRPWPPSGSGNRGEPLAQPDAAGRRDRENTARRRDRSGWRASARSRPSLNPVRGRASVPLRRRAAPPGSARRWRPCASSCCNRWFALRRTHSISVSSRNWVHSCRDDSRLPPSASVVAASGASHVAAPGSSPAFLNHSAAFA